MNIFVSYFQVGVVHQSYCEAAKRVVNILIPEKKKGVFA